MMRHFVKIAALAGLSGAAWFAAAQAAAPWPAAPAPTSWKVEVALGECTLTGVPPGPNPIQVSLLTVTGSDSYDLSLVGTAVPQAPEHNLFPVTIVFGDRRFERDARAARIDRELGNAIVVNGLGPDVAAAFANASGIAIEGSKHVPQIALTHTAAAMRALDGCVRDQLVEWGADPAQFAPGGKRPVALIPRNDWLSRSDWDRITPHEGTVDAVFKVSVATDGSIDGCTPVGPAPEARIQTIACDAVLTRRLFTPATNADGEPVRGVAVFEIHLHVVNAITGTRI